MLTTIATLMLLTATPDADLSQEEDVLVTATPGDRMAGALTGAGLGLTATAAASTVVFAGVWGASGFKMPCFWYCSGDQGGSTLGWALLAGFAVDIVGVLVAMPAGAVIGHQKAGGRGDMVGAFLGTLAGTTLAAACIAGGISMMTSEGGGVMGGVLVALGAGAFFAGPVVGLELSHATKVAPKLSLAPVKQGGMVSLGWEI